MKKLFLLLFLLLNLSLASAIPVINSYEGSFSEGQSIIISGSGFGVKSPVEPLIWDDFEQGIIGSDIQGWELWNDPPHPFPSYTDVDSIGGSQSALLNYEVQGHNAMLHYLDTPVPEMFSSIKYRIVKLGGYNSRNIKLFRLLGHMPGDPVHGNPVIAWGGMYSYSNLDTTDPEFDESLSSWFSSYSPGAGCDISSRNVFYYNTPVNEWHSATQWIVVGDNNTENGLIGRRINDNYNQVNAITYCDGAYQTGIDEIAIGLYLAHDRNVSLDGDAYTDEPGEGWGSVPSSYHIYIDNVYADPTLARIELCDSSIYESGNCEVQIPHTTWVDGQIQFTVNLGSFTQAEIDSGLYLFVVDAEGVVSNAYPVTFSDSFSCNNDNVLNVGEQCDDGNFNDDDGCNSECRYAVPQNNQVHYVDVNNVMGLGCSDSGNGISQPWCSLAAVDSASFVPGDSVVFRSGVYDRFGLDRSGFGYIYYDADTEIKQSGTLENPIVIMSYPGEKVTLRNELFPNSPSGATYPWGYAVLAINAQSFVVVQGFTFNGTFMFMGDSDHNILRGNNFRGLDGLEYNPTSANYAGTMVHYDSDYNLIRNNYYNNYIGGNSGNNIGIQLWGRGVIEENNIIENNLFINNSNAIFDKDTAQWNVFRKNIFINNRNAIDYNNQQEAGYGKFYQNLAIDNDEFVYFHVNPSGFPMNGVQVYNNVVINSPIYSSYLIDALDESLWNNIFISESAPYAFDFNLEDYPSYSDYNLYNDFYRVRKDNRDSTYVYYGFSEWKNLGFDTNSFEADPLFVDEEYHLSVDSPAKGSGRFGDDMGLYPDGDESVVIGPVQSSALVIITPYCGDNVCNNGEDYLSCPADCFAPVCNNNGLCESGEDNNNCPNDCQVIVPSGCVLSSALWNGVSGLQVVTEPAQVSLTVTGSNCDGEEISFSIYEIDAGSPNELLTLSSPPSNAVFSNDVATTFWNTEFYPDVGVNAGTPETPEHIFRASLVSDSSVFVEVGVADRLEVRECFDCCLSVFDLVCDGVLNLSDLVFFVGEFGVVGVGLSSDFNFDGVVDVLDLVLLTDAYSSN